MRTNVTEQLKETVSEELDILFNMKVEFLMRNSAFVKLNMEIHGNDIYRSVWSNLMWKRGYR